MPCPAQFPWTIGACVLYARAIRGVVASEFFRAERRRDIENAPSPADFLEL